MKAFFKDEYIAFLLYQDKSVGDTRCYYHILSQDAFVIIQIQQIVILVY